MTFLTTDDLAPFATIEATKAQAMIDDAEAMAALVAPCIMDATFDNTAAVKAILRGAVLRWNDSGSGALSAQSAGPFGMTLDTRQERRAMFWPSEIQQLQNLCGAAEGAVFSVSIAGADGTPTVPGFPFDSEPGWH